MAELVRTKKGDTRYRWDPAIKDRAFSPLQRRWASATGFCLPPKFGSRSVPSSGSMFWGIPLFERINLRFFAANPPVRLAEAFASG